MTRNTYDQYTFTKEEADEIVEALDSLAIALTDKGHIWTPIQRDLYESAIDKLTY